MEADFTFTAAPIAASLWPSTQTERWRWLLQGGLVGDGKKAAEVVTGRIVIPRPGGVGYSLQLPRTIDSTQLLMALGVAVEGGPPAITIAGLVEWWSPVYLHRLAASADRKRHLGYIAEAIGEHTEESLTPDVIEGMLAKLEKDREIEAQTLNHIRIAGSKLVSDAIHSRKWIGPNPFKAVRPRKVARRQIDMPTPAEVAKILWALPSEWVCLFAVAIFLGLRSGELRGLKPADFDKKNRRLAIRRSGKRKTTKTSQERTVPAPRELVPYLFAATATASSEWLFPDADGGQLRRDFKPCDILRAAMRTAGLGERRLTFHGLRHVSCTLHQEAGCSPWVIALALGHSVGGMTSRYTHLSEATVRAELEKLSLRYSQGELPLTHVSASSSVWIEQRPSKPLPGGSSPRSVCSECGPRFTPSRTNRGHVNPATHARGEANGRATLTADDVRAIRRRRGGTLAGLARKYGVSPRAIRNILNGSSWAHLGLVSR